jgi:outer membrane protein insertion porin family
MRTDKLMKIFHRFWFFLALAMMAGLPAAQAQMFAPRVHKIIIRHIGPPAVSDDFIRANIRTKEGEPFARPTVDEDIKNLYATGYFFTIHVDEDNTPDGLDLTYSVQSKPILTDIKIVGNKKMSTKKLNKKITSKVGHPLDMLKLFEDAQEMQTVYQKAGYQKTTVTVQPPTIDEIAGRGSVTFLVHETPKVKIRDVVFVDAHAFTQKQLRKAIKTRRHWMFSWLTGSGVLKEDDFTDDKDTLVEYYQNEGYIDFAIKDIKFDYVTPNRMVIRFFGSEGRQYKVGTLDITGNKLFTTNDFIKGVTVAKNRMKLALTPGKIFKPATFTKDVDTLRDLYGSRGYLDREQGGTTVIVATRTPNPTTGTIDIAYNIQEGEKCYIEKIEIKGNTKTKDRVLRRELAVYPGEVYDMVRVKISKGILDQMGYFEKVDAEAQDTDVPDRKNLVIGVEEKSTGNFTVGAGYSTVESIVGFVELKQGDFDLFNPPTFTGAGQKFQLLASIGTQMQDYEMNFTEPWFLGKRLSLGVNLFHRYLDYVSANDQYTETFDGGTISLTKALGGLFGMDPGKLRGTASYTFEDAHVAMNSGYTTNSSTNYNIAPGGLYQTSQVNGPNVSTNIYDEHGTYLINKFGFTLAYDTRNNLNLPDRGQRTEINTQIATSPGDTDFYKIELKSGWYFKGFGSNQVLELDGHVGVADTYGGTTQVPIFERWFLGGLENLRGYKYQTVGPEDQFGEPLGGDTYFYGTAEYSIPVIKMVRLAWFYDVGNVFNDPYSFNPNGRGEFTDDAGMGLRIVLPIGGGMPLRLDYGIPIHHDPNLGSSGRVQIGVGYTHNF